MRYLYCVLAMLLSGCGGLKAIEYDSLMGVQPFVLEVEPADGSLVAPDVAVSLAFSQALDEESITPETLAVIPLPSDDRVPLEVACDFEDGDIPALEGDFEISAGAKRITFRADDPYGPGVRYLVIASVGLMSQGRIPLNQYPGSEPTSFVSSFQVIGGSASTGEEGASPAGEEGTPQSVRVRPETLLINEFLYDASGADTEGDLFLELAGDPGSDITGYRILLLNGDDGAIKATIELPEGSLIGDDGLFVIADAITGSPEESHVPDADYIKNFDPQNGPDCLQLMDAAGSVIDALGYGDPIVPIAENGFPCVEGMTALDVSSGQSLSRTGRADSDDNAADFLACDLPTPGSDDCEGISGETPSAE